MDEAALLAAIAEAPHDPVVRLVYADWLEERGDERAEYIRLQESLRHLPAWDDRAWNTRTRRRELQAASPPEWLTALDYQRCYRPLFSAPLPERREDRWRLMHTFIETWHGEVLTPACGNTTRELGAAQRRLDVTLPAAMREFYAQVGKRLDYWGADDPLLTLQNLRGNTDPPEIEFWRGQTPGWAVGLELLHSEDPQVSATLDRDIRVGSSTFSEFMLFTLVREALWQVGQTELTSCETFERLQGLMPAATQWNVCCLTGCTWRRSDVKVIEGRDLLLVYSPQDQSVLTSARSDEAFDSLPPELIERRS